jgi:polyphenol oxidase
LSWHEQPRLERVSHGGLWLWSDTALREQRGVVVAFSERHGGVSGEPFSSLNLAAHVGDSPGDVDANRAALLGALGLAADRALLTCAEQVHGSAIAFVGKISAGHGAFAASGSAPVEAADALITSLRHVPLMLCFADCVPIVLVAPGPMIAVVHAGWRGALDSLPGRAVAALSSATGADPREILVYIGAHIRACHYDVSDDILSQFVNVFGTFARAESGQLDLDAAVTASIESAGVASCNIARLGVCTAEATDHFFSYRAEGGVTGRHAALACIV